MMVVHRWRLSDDEMKFQIREKIPDAQREREREREIERKGKQNKKTTTFNKWHKQ